jgi:hypothetical protein
VAECQANGVAEHLARALARVWCRDRDMSPRLVAGRAGTVVNISFTVEGDTDVYDVTASLNELLAELQLLSANGT